MEFSWQYIHNNYDWLGHIVEAVCIATVVTVLASAFFKRRDATMVGLAFAAGHFHGREKRDFEISVNMPPPHLDAYKFWLWSWDQSTDFWPVAAVVFALLLLIIKSKRDQQK